MPNTSLLPAFARHLAALDDTAWRRLADRVPHMSGDSAQSLLARGDAIAQGLPSAVPSLIAPQFYSPEQRAALYAPFEPDIPFATLSVPPDQL